MMAAVYAARNGCRPLLIEKNEKPGKKMYITGKGRCNLTNACDQEEFLRNVPVNPRFLYSALHLLNPEGTMAFVEKWGCPVKVERGRRVFPVSDKASDVTKAFQKALNALDVPCLYEKTVSGLSLSDGKVNGAVLADGTMIPAKAVLIATGGITYPSTGSTGDGYRLAAQAGHTVIPPQPALVPLVTAESWCHQLTGLSLEHVRLHAEYRGKTLYSEMGEMLFTHFGVSGPLVLAMSCHLRGVDLNKLRVSIDLKPALTKQQVDERLLRELKAGGTRQIKTILETMLPKRLAEFFPVICHVPPEKTASQISSEERKMLGETLKALPLTILGTRPAEEGIITSGGVDIRQINPSTMASRLVPNLFFAGEVMDVNAYTGGYNLQIAFSTGALAGQSAAMLMHS